MRFSDPAAHLIHPAVCCQCCSSATQSKQMTRNPSNKAAVSVVIIKVNFQSVLQLSSPPPSPDTAALCTFTSFQIKHSAILTSIKYWFSPTTLDAEQTQYHIYSVSGLQYQKHIVVQSTHNTNTNTQTHKHASGREEDACESRDAPGGFLSKHLSFNLEGLPVVSPLRARGTST